MRFNIVKHTVAKLLIKNLRTFVSAHPYCAQNSHTTHRARALSSKVNFLQNAPSSSVHLTSSLSCAAVSNPSLTVKVCENDSNIRVGNFRANVLKIMKR